MLAKLPGGPLQPAQSSLIVETPLLPANGNTTVSQLCIANAEESCLCGKLTPFAGTLRYQARHTLLVANIGLSLCQMYLLLLVSTYTIQCWAVSHTQHHCHYDLVEVPSDQQVWQMETCTSREFQLPSRHVEKSCRRSCELWISFPGPCKCLCKACETAMQ